MQRTFTLIALLSLSMFGSTSNARAASPELERAVPPSREAPMAPDRPIRRIRAGAIAGFGFPRPIAVEALAKIDDRLAVGIEYGAMPTISVARVDATTWSLAGDARLFPFGGALFVGVRAGHQHIGAETSLAPLSNRRAELTIDSWYVNPRVGMLWTSPIGLTLGAEVGVQIPFASTLSTNIPSSFERAKTAIDIANGLGRRVIPTIDVLRVGFLL